METKKCTVNVPIETRKRFGAICSMKEKSFDAMVNELIANFVSSSPMFEDEKQPKRKRKSEVKKND